MKLKHKFFIACAMLALCAVPLVVSGCAENEETEYGEWETVTAATCEEAGVERRVSLADPLVTQTRAIPAVGHIWNEWETVTEPTCLVNGVETRTCKTCENSDMRAIPALGHKWGEWETLVAADCESNGTQSRTCLRDGSHTEVSTIRALGHDFSDWVITRAPTCTDAGVETRYCRNCNNHTEVRPVEPYGHEWSSYVVTKQATCTEDGEGMYICRNDAEHVKRVTIKADGHAYGDWVVSVPATETEEGEDIRVCRRDSSHTETRVSPAKGSDGLFFSLNSDGTGYSVRGDRYALRGTVYVPASYRGLPVTEIATNGFARCAEIERILFLGNSVKTVGSFAFARCDKLKSVEFPEGVTTFRPHAFNDCPVLESISLPSTARYLGLINVDSGTYISVILKCPTLKSITVAENNPYIKTESGCVIEKETNAVLFGTANAVIPDYVTEIKRCAFTGSGIENIRIPASVSKIERTAFNSCKKLKEVIFENGELTTLGVSYFPLFGGCVSLERVVLPDNLTVIYGHTFSGCTSLREVVFGNKLQTIDALAFTGCDNIEICEIPASVTKIYGTSFTGAAVSALTIAEDNATYFKDGNCIIERETNKLVAGSDDPDIPDYVEIIGQNAFAERNIESIIIPNSVKIIGGGAFRKCGSLKKVTFLTGSQLETIGERAFEECTALKSVMLPEKLKKICSNAFYNCSALTSVTFGFSDGMFVYGACSLETIESYAFARTGIKTFVINDTVTEIGNYAFTGMGSEQTIKVKGFASQEEADAAWGDGWRLGCEANIVYEG